MRVLATALPFLSFCLSVSLSAQSQDAWTGVISDDHCAASHAETAAKGNYTNRQCIFACVQELGRYVLVGEEGRVIAIANQDLPGLPLYAGRPVRLLGTLKNGTIEATRIEAIAAHLHLFHVMTNWVDTPQNAGLLATAVSDAAVASVHAKLAEGGSLSVMQLHAGHILNALDPGLEPKGPASGYGVKKAVAAARQHLDMSVRAEGVTANIKTHALNVSTALANAAQWTDQAIATATEIRAASTELDATNALERLIALTTAIGEGANSDKNRQLIGQRNGGGLAQAQAQMRLMMAGEGLEHAPR